MTRFFTKSTAESCGAQELTTLLGYPRVTLYPRVAGDGKARHAYGEPRQKLELLYHRTVIPTLCLRHKAHRNANVASFQLFGRVVPVTISCLKAG
jgi:hypothetical protein